MSIGSMSKSTPSLRDALQMKVSVHKWLPFVFTHAAFFLYIFGAIRPVSYPAVKNDIYPGY